MGRGSTQGVSALGGACCRGVETPHPVTATAAGMHHTGMHSCYNEYIPVECILPTAVAVTAWGVSTPKMATAAGGMHPTGMHSCNKSNLRGVSTHHHPNQAPP